ncbi:hypothetical protein RFI_11669, partial [Reticulomyxa filosa]
NIMSELAKSLIVFLKKDEIVKRVTISPRSTLTDLHMLVQEKFPLIVFSRLCFQCYILDKEFGIEFQLEECSQLYNGVVIDIRYNNTSSCPNNSEPASCVPVSENNVSSSTATSSKEQRSDKEISKAKLNSEHTLFKNERDITDPKTDSIKKKRPFSEFKNSQVASHTNNGSSPATAFYSNDEMSSKLQQCDTECPSQPSLSSTVFHTSTKSDKKVTPKLSMPASTIVSSYFGDKKKTDVDDKQNNTLINGVISIPANKGMTRSIRLLAPQPATECERFGFSSNVSAPNFTSKESTQNVPPKCLPSSQFQSTRTSQYVIPINAYHLVMEKLPFHITAPEIVQFLRKDSEIVMIKESDVFLELNARGKTTGNAYVTFANKAHRDEALRKHLTTICEGFPVTMCSVPRTRLEDAMHLAFNILPYVIFFFLKTYTLFL